MVNKIIERIEAKDKKAKSLNQTTIGIGYQDSLPEDVQKKSVLTLCDGVIEAIQKNNNFLEVYATEQECGNIKTSYVTYDSEFEFSHAREQARKNLCYSYTTQITENIVGLCENFYKSQKLSNEVNNPKMSEEERMQLDAKLELLENKANELHQLRLERDKGGMEL